MRPRDGKAYCGYPIFRFARSSSNMRVDDRNRRRCCRAFRACAAARRIYKNYKSEETKMWSLFAPAVALMKRLRYPYKFALIGLVSALAVGFLLFSMIANLHGAIRQAQRELDGVRVVKPLLNTIHALQQHRMLTASVAAGNAEFQDKVPAQQARIAAAVTQVDEALRDYGAAFKLGEDWEGVKKEWADLAGEWSDLTGMASLNAHNALIEHALQLNNSVADASGLVVDPALDSYYLVGTATTAMPAILERLGKLGAAGINVLTRGGNVTDSVRADFTRNLGGLDKMKAELLSGISRSGKYNEAIKPQLEDFQQKFAVHIDNVVGVVDNEIASGNLSSSPAAFLAKAIEATESGYAELGRSVFPTIERLIGERVLRHEALLYFNLAIAAALVLAFAYLSVGFYLATIEGVRSLSGGAERIANGDLTARVALDSKDELTQAGQGFNAMAVALAGLIGKVQASAGAVSSAATRMATSSSLVNEGSQQQSEAAASMAAAIQQSTVGINHIAEFARDAQTMSSEAGELSDQGSEIVNRTVDEMQVIAGTVKQAAELIEELGRQSENISAIVNVIKEIADQTNLLALNAAIEAARAGEQGRGFAVVADEVRKLAERTTSSTQDISTMITAIQSGTAQAVSSMQEGVTRVAAGVELAQSAGAAMEKIRTGTARVVHSIKDISRALTEQGAASNEIAGNVERIARMADENHAAIAHTTSTAQQLEQLAVALQHEVRRYRVSPG
jgi:methyl-accepting chemotaxis protein